VLGGNGEYLKSLQRQFARAFMKPFIDYYAILGISPKATTIEIKTAFKNQSLKWHPDRNRGTDTTNKMQEINEANRILSNNVLRVKYNREYSRAKKTISTKQNKPTQQAEGKSEPKQSTQSESVKQKVNYSCNLRSDEDLIRICVNASNYNLEFINVVLCELYKRNYTLETILERIKPEPQNVKEEVPQSNLWSNWFIKCFSIYSPAISLINHWWRKLLN